MKKTILVFLSMCVGFLSFGQNKTVSTSTKYEKKLKNLSYSATISTKDLDTIPEMYQSELSAVQAAGLWRSVGSQNLAMYDLLLVDGINVIPGQNGRSGILLYNSKIATWMVEIWCDKKLHRSSKPKRFFAPRKKPAIVTAGFCSAIL
jgi:hypothetical protein